MIKKHLMRYLALFLSSSVRASLHRGFWRLRAVFKPELKNAEVYLRAKDPYSFLLIQALPELQQRFKLKWDVYIVDDLQADMYPKPELWHDNALQDAIKLAGLYGFITPKKVSLDESQIQSATAHLLTVQKNKGSIEQFKQVFLQLWQEQAVTPKQIDETGLELLQQNQQRLIKRGHYLSASIWHLGSWFWGLDRLDHLERQLNHMQLNKGEAQIHFNKTYVNFCRPYPTQHVKKSNLDTPLILYFSIRSPYSHLALERCRKLARHYKIPLVIKPVVPMVMRGLKVPPSKKFYIFFDTKREADKHEINYGFVADPLGDGVKRCYALFDYAKEQGKEIDFLSSYSHAVNAEGVLSDSGSGLKLIVERAGLSWPKAKQILQTTNWQNTWPSWAEQHEAELMQSSLWGVPSIKYQDCVVWGQDRLEFIEQKIREHLLNH